MNFKNLFIGVVGVGLVSPFAVADEFDVAPRVVNNAIFTDAYSDEFEFSIDNVRVFAYEFGEIPGQPFYLPDPGFHPLPGSGFAPGTVLSFAVLSGLSFWDGSGPVSFGAVPGGETLRLELGSNSITVGNAPPAPAGFAIEAVDANGEFDEHLDSYLERGGGLDPTDGIYLISMELIASDPAIANSAPLYILYNNELDDELLGDAREWVRDTFAPGTNLPEIPEPSLLGLAVLPVVLMMRRNRN